MPAETIHIEKELFRQIAIGDEHAFRSLFDLYKTKIYFFILHIVHTEAEAEELVQEVFMRLWISRQSLVNVENPDSYLFIMARNRSLDYIQQVAGERKLKQQLQQQQEFSANTTEEDIDFSQSKQLVDAAVSQLPKQQELVFRLSKEQGLSRQQIAQQLNISENTVRNHLAEAIKFIKNYLQQHGDVAFLFFIWHYC